RASAGPSRSCDLSLSERRSKHDEPRRALRRLETRTRAARSSTGLCRPRHGRGQCRCGRQHAAVGIPRDAAGRHVLTPRQNRHLFAGGGRLRLAPAARRGDLYHSIGLTMNESSPTNGRSPLIAVVLSLFATGLGHVYCGRIVTGLALFLASLLLVPVAVGAA